MPRTRRSGPRRSLTPVTAASPPPPPQDSLNERTKSGSLRYELHKKAKASLGAGHQIKESVKLPQGDDPNEWLAVHGTKQCNGGGGRDLDPKHVNDSGRLFQPHQPHLWNAERVLHDQDVPQDDRGSPVTQPSPKAEGGMSLTRGPAADSSTFGRTKTTQSTRRQRWCPRQSTLTCSCRGSRRRSTTRTSSLQMSVGDRPLC